MHFQDENMNQIPFQINSNQADTCISDFLKDRSNLKKAVFTISLSKIYIKILTI